MRLRTLTTRRVATAGIALVTAATLTACASDTDEDASADGPTPETSENVDESAPQAPVDELILAEGEAPGGGVVNRLEHDQIRERVEQIMAAQNEQLMEDPACDRVSRLPTIVNYSLDDAVNSLIRYKESETDETEHRFGVGMVDERLDEFLDRSLYEACDTSVSSANPDKVLTMNVEDAPAVDGAEGFRVTSDFVTTEPDGTQTMLRHVSIHGFARDTTVSVEYEAQNNDPGVDPVLPTAAGALDAIYTEQMEKLVAAE